MDFNIAHNIHTYIHTYIHTFVLTQMHILIHTYIYTTYNAHLRTYILTYIHTHYFCFYISCTVCMYVCGVVFRRGEKTCNSNFGPMKWTPKWTPVAAKLTLQLIKAALFPKCIDIEGLHTYIHIYTYIHTCL